MSSRIVTRLAIIACSCATALAACGGGVSQLSPSGIVGQRAFPVDIAKIPKTGGSVAHDSHLRYPDGIIYTRDNQVIDNATYNLDLNNDGKSDFTVTDQNAEYPACGNHPNSDTFLSLSGTGSNGVEFSGRYVAKLAAGSLIGPSQGFSGGGYMQYKQDHWILQSSQCMHQVSGGGNWPPDYTSGYVGLVFVTGGQTHYGWAEITVYPIASWVIAVLTGYAYETKADKAITAGQM